MRSPQVTPSLRLFKGWSYRALSSGPGGLLEVFQLFSCGWPEGCSIRLKGPSHRFLGTPTIAGWSGLRPVEEPLEEGHFIISEEGGRHLCNHHYAGWLEPLKGVKMEGA